MTEQRVSGFLIFLVLLVIVLSSAITWKVLSLNEAKESSSNLGIQGNSEYLTGGQVAIEVHPKQQVTGGA